LAEITDTGVGIPANQQSRVFAKFFRGSNILQFEDTALALGCILPKPLSKQVAAKFGLNPKKTRAQLFILPLPVAA